MFNSDTGEEMTKDQQEQRVRQLDSQRDLALAHAMDLETEAILLCGMPTEREARAHAREFMFDHLQVIIDSAR